MHFFSFYTFSKQQFNNNLRDMKYSKILILSLISILTLSGCGSSADDAFPGGGTGGSSGTGGSTVVGNTNCNVATSNMPTEVAKAIKGLEFPKVKGTTGNYVIVHTDNTTNTITYSTEWDDTKKAQRWSCYNFNTTNSQKNVSGRYEPSQGERQYPYDTDLKAQYGVTDFTSDPYTGNYKIIDHGHICPNADRFYNANQRYQTYYMTNMQPQYSAFNQKGTWYKMEDELRKFAPKLNTDTLFVVKGGTIDDPNNIIEYMKNSQRSTTAKDGYIPVPKYFFVAVLNKTFSKSKNAYTYQAFGYWFPHVNEAMATSDKLSNYLVNIKTLQDYTGIDFFCNLPDDIENKVESASLESIKLDWGFK